MFNLEQSIAEWRQQVLAAGIKTPVPLEELESHLREETEQQVRAGTDEARAFEIAVQRIGQPAPLKKEFMKTANFKWMLWQKIKPLFGIRDVPALDTFEPAALQTLNLAAGEARGFHHNFIGTEHILLGLIKPESNMVSKVMRRLGVEDKAIRIEIEKFVGHGPANEVSVKIPFTPCARKALRLAADTARTLNQPYVNAEHIFLGLILEGDGVAGRVLKNFGIQIENAREEVLREIRRAGS
jgi:hypothetical protein